MNSQLVGAVPAKKMQAGSLPNPVQLFIERSSKASAMSDHVNAGSNFSSDRSVPLSAGSPLRSNQAYRIGITIKVRNVELRMPSMTMIASGRFTSALVPVAMAIGVQ